MALEQKLHLKLAQKLVMTPTLQQAIKLLQLSRLELEQALAQELQVNPVLELSEDPPTEDEPSAEAAAETAAETAEDATAEQAAADIGGVRDGAAAAGSGETAPAEPAGEEVDAAPADPFSEVDVDALFANYLHDTARVPATWEEEEDSPMENSAGPVASMFDALCDQLRIQEIDTELRLIGEFIIGNLDPDGYLRLSDQDIATQLGVRVEQVAEALAAVRRLEPPGLAARSLQECLLLQLDRHPEPEAPGVRLARRVLADTFEDFLHQRWERLQQRLGVTRDDVRHVLDVVRHLRPRPGTQLGPSDNSVIEPDVAINKVDDAWRVTLNDEGFPRLRLSSHYLRLLASRQADSETNGYLRERVRAALWFLRSVEQRQNTITRVVDAIVRRQTEFLDRGLPYLRPLVLRDIADDIGMHESTVSRVVANKYVATPRGVLPLKFFFHSAISHAVDGDISSVVVKSRIKELIAGEEARKPLSDARVARQLNRLGIRIARRTVAKYREELGIPSSEQRRRVLR